MKGVLPERRGPVANEKHQKQLIHRCKEPVGAVSTTAGLLFLMPRYVLAGFQFSNVVGLVENEGKSQGQSSTRAQACFSCRSTIRAAR